MKLWFLLLAFATSARTRTCRGFSSSLRKMTPKRFFRTGLSSKSNNKERHEEISDKKQVENNVAEPTNPKQQYQTISDRHEVEDIVASSSSADDTSRRSFSTVRSNNDANDKSNTVDRDPLPVHKAIQSPAGLLCNDHDLCAVDDTTNILPHIGRSRKRGVPQIL